MKKRLGAIPKGLEWISDQSDQDIVVSSKTEKVVKEEPDQEFIPAAKRGLPEELIRATFILRQEYLAKIKAYAYWERLQIKEVFDEICEQFFKNKKIKSLPTRRK